MTAATALTIADTAAAAVMTAPMAHLRFALGPRLIAAQGTRQDDAPAGLAAACGSVARATAVDLEGAVCAVNVMTAALSAG